MAPIDTRVARLADVIAIPVTPYAEDGSVDLAGVRRLARRLVDAGVRVLTAGGNTGEFYALNPTERRAALAATVDEVGDQATVVSGVGLDLDSAIADAAYADEQGAAMVMVHQPVHPYVSAEGWIAYHAAIADAVPGLGVVPYVRDPRLSGLHLGRLADRCPNVVGVKYSVPDAMRFASVAHDAASVGTVGERLVWIAGLAEPYAPSYFQAGARGFTSGLVNVEPRLSLELLESLRDGDFPKAQEQFGRIRRFEELRAADASADNVSVVKEAMAQLGLCRRDVRPPINPLSSEKRAAVTEILHSWDLDV